MRAPLFVALLVCHGIASAGCFGSETFYTCNDASGNAYTVNKLGNTTLVNGQNQTTGSQWNERSTRVGNTTYIDGQAANGRNWNSTITTNGGVTTQSGTDSRGQPFTKVCTAYGCF